MIVIDCEKKTEPLIGLTIDAAFNEMGGEKNRVPMLRTISGVEVAFNAQSHDLSRFFEVFSLEVSIREAEERAWTSLGCPMEVKSVRKLWRTEWLAPAGKDASLLGAAPHFMHFVGTGPVPSAAVASAKVCAGVQLLFEGGKSFVALASSSEIFHVDLATELSDVDTLLHETAVDAT